MGFVETVVADHKIKLEIWSFMEELLIVIPKRTQKAPDSGGSCCSATNYHPSQGLC
jgi:hypothetical protein